MKWREAKLKTKGDAWRESQIEAALFHQMETDDANGLGVSTIMPEAKAESCAYFAQLCPILAGRMKIFPNSPPTNGKPMNLANSATRRREWLETVFKPSQSTKRVILNEVKNLGFRL